MYYSDLTYFFNRCEITKKSIFVKRREYVIRVVKYLYLKNLTEFNLKKL